MKKKNFKKLTIALLACLTCVGAFAWLSDSAVSTQKSELDAAGLSIHFANEATPIELTGGEAIPMTLLYAVENEVAYNFDVVNDGDLTGKYALSIDPDTVEGDFDTSKVNIVVNPIVRTDYIVSAKFINGEGSVAKVQNMHVNGVSTQEDAVNLAFNKAGKFGWDNYASYELLTGSYQIYKVQDLKNSMHIGTRDVEGSEHWFADEYGHYGYESEAAMRAAAVIETQEYQNGSSSICTSDVRTVATALADENILDAAIWHNVPDLSGIILRPGEVNHYTVYVYLDASMELDEYIGKDITFGLKLEAEQYNEPAPELTGVSVCHAAHPYPVINFNLASGNPMNLIGNVKVNGESVQFDGMAHASNASFGDTVTVTFDFNGKHYSATGVANEMGCTNLVVTEVE